MSLISCRWMRLSTESGDVICTCDDSRGCDPLVVLPGDTIAVKDSVGRYMVKENWAAEVE